MPPIPATPPALHVEVAASIDATLIREARRNELRLAMVRVASLSGVACTETWYQLSNGALPLVYRAPTALYLVFSVGLWMWLRSGRYHRGIGVALPLLDGAYIGVRLQLTFAAHTLAVLEQSMELATVTAGAALLILSGGFRLSRASLLTASISGVALYLTFALQTHLKWPQMLVHGVVLGGIAASTAMLTTQVRRAVRSEVSRVTLSRFLPSALLDGVDDDPIALITQPRSVRATVLVSDIRGFTQWAEHRSPIEVLGALNVVQGRLAAIVREHHGMVDKFMGDGMLAVFGTPEPRADHARCAVEAALQMQRAVRLLSDTGQIGFQVGIGVHTGELVVGCLGSGLRMEFTVLGDTVNTASRLEGLTKTESLGLLVSDVTAAEAGHPDLVPHATVELRGRDTPMQLWAVAPSASAI